MPKGNLPIKPLGPAKTPLAAGGGLLGVDPEKVLLTDAERGCEGENERSGEEGEKPGGFEEADDGLDLDDDPREARVEKLISVVTLLLTMLLLGGSIVFWWVMLRYLFTSPYSLVNAGQMRVLMLSCALAPVVVTAVQALLRRDMSVERWLICMCIGGALATLAVTVRQLCVVHEPFAMSDALVMLCCAVSGCALPAGICFGARKLAQLIAESNRRANSLDWEKVSSDVRSLSDFDL